MSSSAQLANAVQGARAVAAQGDVRGAFTLLDQALDGASGTLGGDDPDVLAATCVLAKFHTDLGELGNARRLLEEGLAAGYHRLGDGHAVMLALSYELARIADELGNVYEAKRRYGQLARLGPATLGEDHPSVRAARRYLGLPEPEGAFHVPHQSAPAPFEPLSAPTGTTTPAQPTWPVDQRAGQPAGADQPRPWTTGRSSTRSRARRTRPRSRGPRRGDPRSRTTGTASRGTPARRHSTGPAAPTGSRWTTACCNARTRRPGRPPTPPTRPAATPTRPAAAARYPTSGGAFPTSGGAYPTSGDAYPSNGAFPSAAVQERAPWTPGPDAPPLPLPAEQHAARRRSPLVALLVILIVAVLGGITAAVVSFVVARPDPPAARQQDQPPSGAAPSQSGPTGQAAQSGAAAGNPKAPGALKLRDDKTSITLTWTDPSKGSVPFIVAGGQQGALRQLQVLAAGATTYTLNGLNPKLDYCFTVAAIYGTDSVALSDLACTQRK